MKIDYYAKVHCTRCGKLTDEEISSKLGIEIDCEECDTKNILRREHVIAMSIHSEDIVNEFEVYHIDHEKKKALIDPNPCFAEYGKRYEEKEIKLALEDVISKLGKHQNWKDYSFIVKEKKKRFNVRAERKV